MKTTIMEEINRINALAGTPAVVNEMMSTVPVDLENNADNVDQQILRVGIISELDAVNLYEQMANKATNPDVKNLLLDIAKEEKTHVGEFETMLLRLDNEQKIELKAGEKETNELVS